MSTDTELLLPYSKLLSLDDYKHPGLARDLAYVDRWGRDLQHQHEHRRWEYAMALRALRQDNFHRRVALAYDVGGAGSPFTQMLAGGVPVRVIDPTINVRFCREADFASADAIFAISVIEHLERSDWPEFIEAVSRTLRPGGLFFLTTDVLAPGSTEDRAHFHWMRMSWSTPESLVDWAFDQQHENGLKLRSMGSIEDFDWEANGGPHVYDYNFACLTFHKSNEE